MNREKKAELDQEELQRRKFRAKCRFRAIVRMVMANNYWLAEAVEEYEGDNVKLRVEQAVRGKSKKKQLLNIHDKALLNRPAADRTDHEKRYIYRIIGGLKCFKRYPDHVKRKLAAVTYFKYYGPDRVIVRQNQEAHAMYFIVTGDVIISLLIYDEVIQETVPLALGQMHTGDMFGEVSLLHNIKRTATCTTFGHCEFLALMKQDFKDVLQASLQKQWDEIHLAMSSFTYFENYDQVALREGCIVAKMKSYDCNETILGDGCGISTYVYFVLSGVCQMIEQLQVKVATNPAGKEIYTLHDPFVDQTEEEIDFDKKYFRNLKKESETSKHQELADVTDSTHESSKDTKLSNSTFPEKSSLQLTKSKVDLEPPSKLKFEFKTSSEKLDTKDVSATSNATTSDHPHHATKSQSILIQSRPSAEKVHDSGVQSKISHTTFHPNEKIHDERRESIRYDVMPGPDAGKSNKIKTCFMQVCQFLPGSTFGFGENMRDRRIIALTRVDCMLMPYVWLMQRNTVNIWTRIQHYLNTKIPKKQKLFEEFVRQRQWYTHRDRYLHDVVGQKKRVNFTTISDVPYFIRMEELEDMF